jgi:methylmalonyl-CoA mutase N-terminal domain/subunit
LETEQVRHLQSVRQTRDASAVRAGLERLDAAARSDENLMPHILNAVEAYASVGEISDVFRRVHGEFREALAL